jgi:putative transposase
MTCYQRTNRTKYLIVYHFIFVVKYRKPLLNQYGQEMKNIFRRIAMSSDFTIKELEVEGDHIHVLVTSLPRISPAQIVRRLKAESTKHIWQNHPELKQDFWKERTFWSDGYFCTSIGNASIETIRQYIANQG